MRRIRIISEQDEYRPSVQRIQQILAANGFASTEEECRELWQRYSDSMAAGWMHLPEDDAEVFAAVSPYFEDGAEL